MPEYIKREAVCRACKKSGSECTGRSCEIPYIPASDVAPVRHGRWIKRGYACGENEYECSVCHETEWRTSASRMKYCMFCGAKMVEEGC